MRFLTIVGFVILLILPIRILVAAELVMFDSPACQWCELWEEEIGIIYNKTDEGRKATLRRVSIFGDRPKDLEILKKIRYTPTFVLLDHGREVGRINGYPGEDNFWFLLGDLIKKMESQTAACSTAILGENPSC